MTEGECTIMNNLKEQMFLKTINFATDEFKVALYSVALANPDGAAPVYSLTNEITATNYTAGGKVLTGNAVTQDDASDRAKFDLNDATWTSLGTHTIAEARLYDNTTTSKWLLCLWEIATNSNGGNYTLQFSSDGVLQLG